MLCYTKVVGSGERVSEWRLTDHKASDYMLAYEAMVKADYSKYTDNFTTKTYKYVEETND